MVRPYARDNLNNRVYENNSAEVEFLDIAKNSNNYGTL